MNNKIEIQNVNKFYGKKQALKDINLVIHQGMFGLLGRNGAGKTTLMKTLATLHHANSGKITICGVPV
ncbi:MAG: ATP-binding cassette domain-containing protein, partial [Oscillospiraceae bacterium]|nr:ATP-binding cassette domain-containing protein [Oscillospiraceae bacterium]